MGSLRGWPRVSLCLSAAIPALLSCAIAGAACAAGAVEDSCEVSVLPAVERLLEKRGEGWAFVIVEPEGGEEYVQFGVEEEGVFLDLPLLALSPRAQARARTLFAEAGVAGPVEVGAPDPEDPNAVSVVQSFQLRFGTRAEEASRFACRVLGEVYELPAEARLVITEDE